MSKLQSLKNNARSIQFYTLMFLAGLTAIALYVVQGAMATNHDPKTWSLTFWAVDWGFWGLRALVEVWVIGFMFSTKTETKGQQVILYFFEGLAIILITFTIGPAIRSLGYLENVLTSLGEPYFTIWSFGIAAYTSVLIAGTGIAYRIQGDVKLDNQDNNVVNYQQLEERIKELQGHNEANRELLKSILNGLKYLENMNMSDLIALVIYSSNGNMPDVTPSHLATLFNTSPITAKKALDKAQEMKQKLGRM